MCFFYRYLESSLVTPANLAYYPLPSPKVKLQYTSNVSEYPVGGIKIFARRNQLEATLVDDEEGKFIFPPSGSFLIFLSNPETPDVAPSGKVGFGWWEEPICYLLNNNSLKSSKNNFTYVK